jgi:hypothetical protein
MNQQLNAKAFTTAVIFILMKASINHIPIAANNYWRMN